MGGAFTHKATGAWDALTKGLMEAGFVITASWPVNTEAEGSLHIRNKAAANSTIFLVCRPRGDRDGSGEVVYWEDVELRMEKAVRARIEAFQEAGIAGVDLYLASFGPALEEFSRHWPLKRGTPRERPEERRRRRQPVLFEDEWDSYAATPEDALDAARREVKRWRLEKLTHLKADADACVVGSQSRTSAPGRLAPTPDDPSGYPYPCHCSATHAPVCRPGCCAVWRAPRQ